MDKSAKTLSVFQQVVNNLVQVNNEIATEIDNQVTIRNEAQNNIDNLDVTLNGNTKTIKKIQEFLND